MLAWLTFGVVEHLMLTVLPALRESSFLFSPARLIDWLATLALYAALGAGAGAVLGAIVARAFAEGEKPGPRGRESIAADAALLVLAVLWLLHLGDTRWLSRSVYLAMAVAGLVIGALVFRLSSRRASVHAATSLLASPFGAAICLLAPLAWRNQLHITTLAERFGASASSMKAAISAGGTGFLVVLLVAAPLLAGRSRRALPSAAWSRRAKGVAAALAGTAVLAGWADARALARLRGDDLGTPRTVAGVLLITLDGVRADHLSAYGYPHPTSPSLDRLARQATVYRDVLAASDMSLGTHASILTGKYPSRHGAWEAADFPVGRPLAPGETTMAERLAGAGYAAIGVAGNGYYLNGAYGLTRGFDVFEVRPRDRLEFRVRLRSHFARLAGLPESTYTRAAEINAALRRGVEAAAGERGFLAFANYMEAHAPYEPDAEFERSFPGYSPAVPRGERFIGAGGTGVVLDETRRRHFVSQYDAAIASVDRQLGVLFDDLRRQGLYDSLMVVVLGDHGEMLGEENGVFGHGAGLAEEVLRVPLIVKYPHQQTGRTVHAPVSQVDVLPTVLDVLGLPIDRSLDGTSLRGIEGLPPRTLLAESPPSVAIYRGNRKLLVQANGKRALFALKGDGGHSLLLPDDHPDGLSLRRALDSWLVRGASEPRRVPDPATRDRLKSLYVR